MRQSQHSPITPEQERAIRRLIDRLPAKYRLWAGAALTVILVLAGAYMDWKQAPDPGYAATAILDSGADVNVIVRDGVGQTYRPEYDDAGHARLLSVTSNRLTDSVGIAPVMGWNLPYINELPTRGLRYCAAEMAAHPALQAEAVRALRDTFDRTLNLPPAKEDCAWADIVLGINPEVDCGTPLALGCAAHRGQYVRVTVQPTLPLEAVYWVTVHEAKHAGDLGHTGHYGGERRPHSHCSDLGFIDVGVGGTNRPVDNPSGRPCLEDWEDGAGNLRHRFRKTTPTPTPPPTAAQLWLHRKDGIGDCTTGGDDNWLVISCPAPRGWARLTTDGLTGDFVELKP